MLLGGHLRAITHYQWQSTYGIKKKLWKLMKILNDITCNFESNLIWIGLNSYSNPIEEKWDNNSCKMHWIFSRDYDSKKTPCHSSLFGNQLKKL
jgi:hypothetical protein